MVNKLNLAEGGLFDILGLMSFIPRLLFHIIATAAVFWAIETYIFPGSFTIVGEGYERYALVALIFGLLNTFVKPLLKLLMLPVQFFTLGLAGLAINGLLVAAIGFALNALELQSASIVVENWLIYFLVGLLVGAANTVIHWFS